MTTLDAYLEMYWKHEDKSDADAQVFQVMGILDLEQQVILTAARQDLEELDARYAPVRRRVRASLCGLMSGCIAGIFGVGIGYFIGYPEHIGGVLGGLCGALTGYSAYEKEKTDYRMNSRRVKEDCQRKLNELARERQGREIDADLRKRLQAWENEGGCLGHGPLSLFSKPEKKAIN